MIKRYIKRTTKALENCDDARTIFIQETKNLEQYIEHETEKKCFNVFLAGVLSSTIIISVTIYIYSGGKGAFYNMLIGGF